MLTALVATGACWEPAVAEDETLDPSQSIYASPDGSIGGDGSKERPFDLETALSGDAPVRPGGTVWLRGGTYRVGAITSALVGAESAPITVRPAPGEHAVIDGRTAIRSVLTVNGAWTIFRDFEVTSSDPVRSGSALRRAGGIDVHGPNVKLVNLVVHDLASGLGIWSDAVDAEAYGNIIYYNGWLEPDRPHGHGIYTQNKTGIRRLSDNVIFGQFGMGIHAYASEQGFLDDILLEGNVVVNNGLTPDFNIMVGGHRLANRPTLISNYTFDDHGLGSNVGYSAGCEGAVLRDNYLVSGGNSLQFVNCEGVLEGNVVVGRTRAVVGRTIVTHPELMAQHPANEFVGERPSATRTFVRPNRFAPGRAHVIVYNWERLPAVQVDLASAAVPVGAAFEVRDVRNLGRGPIVSGRYSGAPVTIPLHGLTVAPIVGWQPTPPHTAPEFGVFLVTSHSAPRSRFGALVSRVLGALGL